MSIEFDDEFSERIVSTDATPADDGGIHRAEQSKGKSCRLY